MGARMVTAGGDHFSLVNGLKDIFKQFEGIGIKELKQRWRYAGRSYMANATCELRPPPFRRVGRASVACRDRDYCAFHRNRPWKLSGRFDICAGCAGLSALGRLFECRRGSRHRFKCKALSTRRASIFSPTPPIGLHRRRRLIYCSLFPKPYRLKRHRCPT